MRRGLLAAAVGLAAAAPAGAQAPAEAWTRAFGDSPQELSDRTTTATGQTTRGVPLGGMGAGSFMWNLTGTFGPWELDTARHHEVFPAAGGFAVWEPGRATALATRGVMSAWPTLDTGDATYSALFPRAWVEYGDVTIEQVTPFIPGDERASSLPVGTFSVRLSNRGTEPVDRAVMLAFPNFFPNRNVARGDLSNTVTARDSSIAVTMAAGERNPPRTRDTSWTIAARAPGAELTALRSFDASGDGARVWEAFADDGRLSDAEPDSSDSAGAVAARVHLEPGEAKTVTFAIAWSFPIVEFGHPDAGAGSRWLRRWTEWFDPAEGSEPIARAALDESHAWRQAVRDWQRPILESERVPDWLAQGALNELYYSTFGGVFWENGNLTKPKELLRDGHSFLEREAVAYPLAESLDVRHYGSVQKALLHPQIERDVLAQYADAALASPQRHLPHDLGIMDLDTLAVQGEHYFEHTGIQVGDPLFGPRYGVHPTSEIRLELDTKYALMVWEYVRLTGDESIVPRVWEAVKGGYRNNRLRDLDGNGIPDNLANDAYDLFPFRGTSAYTGGFFVAALGAYERLGQIAGDDPLVAEVRALAPRARANLEAALWNPATGYYRIDTLSHYGDGILADAMLPQSDAWANDLPVPYENPERVTSHLRQAWERLALPNRGGAIGANNAMAANGQQVQGAGAYPHEIWPGVNYRLAGAMVEAGRRFGAPDLVEKGLVLGRGVHDTSWNSEESPFWFNVPEAWHRGNPAQYRAPQYQRVRAIWDLLLTADPSLERALSP